MIACSCQELSHNIYNKSAVKFLYKLISRCLFLTEGNPQLDWITSEPRELFRRHLDRVNVSLNCCSWPFCKVYMNKIEGSFYRITECECQKGPKNFSKPPPFQAGGRLSQSGWPWARQRVAGQLYYTASFQKCT